MKILFLNPSSLVTENVIRDMIYGCWCKGKRIGGAITPPHPLLSVATILEKEGHEVRLIDAPAQKLKWKEQERIAERYEVVIVSSSIMTFSEDTEILLRLKEGNNNRLITIIFGAQPTFLSEYSLKKSGIDIIILGEPEYIIRDLINAISNKDYSWRKIKGIGFRNNGKVIINERYPLIENLDRLPFVNWRLIPENAKYAYPLVERYPFSIDLTSRGCPYRCIYCMSPAFYGHKIRCRSAENVVEGFRILKKQGFREIYLKDEIFTISKNRVHEICRLMIMHKLDLTWLCSARIGTVDKDLMRHMKEAGCHTIKFGVESGSQEILDKSLKEITLSEIRETFKWAREIGMKTHAHFLLGLPGETRKTVEETIRFVKEIKPTTITFGIVMPYPGTELFRRIKEKHPEITDLVTSNLNLKTVHATSFMHESFCDLDNRQLQYYLKKAYRSFYLRPLYILNRLREIKDLAGLKRLFSAGRKVIDFSLYGD